MGEWSNPQQKLLGGLVAIFYFPIFPRNIGNVIIPIDELIFFRGVAQPPTRIILPATPIPPVISPARPALWRGTGPPAALARPRGLLRRPGEGHGHGKVEGRQPNIWGFRSWNSCNYIVYQHQKGGISPLLGLLHDVVFCWFSLFIGRCFIMGCTICWENNLSIGIRWGITPANKMIVGFVWESRMHNIWLF